MLHLAYFALFLILARGWAETRPTEVIHYKPPSDLPAASKRGECWTSSIAAFPRIDAWRCQTGNLIYDPCFSTSQKDRVLCDVNPATGKQGFQLILTKPLPAAGSAQAERRDSALWLMELEDGVWCSPFTGTNPEFNGQIAHWGCRGGSMLLGDLQTNTPNWTAKRIVVAQTKSGPVIQSAATVGVKRVWE